MCRDIRVLGIRIFLRHFLGIMGILGFYGFMIFPNCHNTLILQSCTLFSE